MSLTPHSARWLDAMLAVARHYGIGVSEEGARVALAWEQGASADLMLLHMAKSLGLALRFGKLSLELLDAWRLPAADSAPAGSGTNALAVGAAISLANPKNIVYWGALGSALSGIVGATPSHTQTLMFFGGFMLASVLSCFLTAALVNLLRKNASPTWQRISYAACGVVLIYLAVLAAQGI